MIKRIWEFKTSKWANWSLWLYDEGVFACCADNDATSAENVGTRIWLSQKNGNIVSRIVDSRRLIYKTSSFTCGNLIYYDILMGYECVVNPLADKASSELRVLDYTKVGEGGGDCQIRRFSADDDLFYRHSLSANSRDTFRMTAGNWSIREKTCTVVFNKCGEIVERTAFGKSPRYVLNGNAYQYSLPNKCFHKYRAVDLNILDKRRYEAPTIKFQIVDDALFICGSDLMRWSLDNFESHWELETQKDHTYSDFTIHNGVMYIGCMKRESVVKETTVLGVDIETGEIVARYDLPWKSNFVRSRPTIKDNLLIVTDYRAGVSVFNLSTCELIDKYEKQFSNPQPHPALVDEQHIYCCGDIGPIICLERPDKR